MKSMRVLRLAGCVAVGLMLATGAEAGDRTAQEILDDYKAVERPMYDRDRQDEEGYVEQYREQARQAQLKQADFILELFQTHPDHEQVLTLMPRRWQMLMYNDEHTQAITEEIDQIIKTASLVGEARFAKATMSVQSNLRVPEEDRNIAAAKEDIHAFLTARPDDDRGARLLNSLANAYDAGSDEQIEVYKRIKHEYPDSTGAKYADGKIRQATSIGKPFELAFTDAITGSTIDMNNLRGQVVVIDYWATWCGPCIAEMPMMKKLYEEFHEDGVEFIGVSLDKSEEDGGLEKLREYVKTNEVPWPQYYQGNFWSGEFSVSWGINSIPALFIVDKNGNLRSVQGRGKLEELIPELLAE